jgi:squalene synthase HpnC
MESGQSAQSTALAALDAVSARAPGQMGAENFPVALRLLPAGPRARLSAVYAFARFVDDVGDRAPGSASDRLALLDVVEQQLRAVPEEGARVAAVAGLRDVLAEGVPMQPFLDLIEANRIDQRVGEYETFDDLLGYCRYSASPVGRIVLHVAGAATGANLTDSDAVCDALQVLEHCQDVGEDARAGRVYLPAAELRSAGVSRDELAGRQTCTALRAVVAVQAARAEAMLHVGPVLVRRLRGWARVAVAGYVAGGLATAAALRRARYDVLAQQIRPSRGGTAVRCLRVMAPW